MGGSRVSGGRKATIHELCVGPEVHVTFSYDLYDGDGEWVESSNPVEPPSFLFGFGQMVPAVERALDGGRVGHVRRVRLSAREAYGERIESALIEVDRAELPADVAVGDELQAEDTVGQAVCLKVLEVADDRVVLDTNHPLAGQSVELDITIEQLELACAKDVSEALARLEQSAERGVQSLLPAERLLKRDEAPQEQEDGSQPARPPGALKSTQQA